MKNVENKKNLVIWQLLSTFAEFFEQKYIRR